MEKNNAQAHLHINILVIETNQVASASLASLEDLRLDKVMYN